MDRAEVIDQMFEEMRKGMFQYKIIRINDSFILDFQNGFLAGDLKIQ